MRLIHPPSTHTHTHTHTHQGVLLNLALINYALSFLVRRGFTPVQTPFFMRKARRRGCMLLMSGGPQTRMTDGTVTPAGVHERVRAAGGL